MKSLEEKAFSLLQNFEVRKRQILIGAGAVLAGIIVLVSYFLSASNPLTYAQAKAVYAKWEASPDDVLLLNQMKEAIRKTPMLEERYESVIAQKLLDIEKLEEAMQMAVRSLQRVKEATPFHADYAQTSLLIEQKEYQQALEKAVALKEHMERSFDTTRFLESRLVGGALLYVHNLLRIACLQQELKNRPGEKAAWEELEVFLQKENPLSGLMLGSFSEKQLDLTQYIAERKKQL